MNYTAYAILVSLVLPAIGLLAWLCFAMTRVIEQLRGFSSFEGMHFEVSAPD